MSTDSRVPTGDTDLSEEQFSIPVVTEDSLSHFSACDHLICPSDQASCSIAHPSRNHRLREICDRLNECLFALANANTDDEDQSLTGLDPEFFQQVSSDDLPLFPILLVQLTPFHCDPLPEDEYADIDGKQAKPRDQMLRAFVLGEALQLNPNELWQYLDDHPELVDAIGFDGLPHKTTFYEAKNERFEDFDTTIPELAERAVYRTVCSGCPLPGATAQWLEKRKTTPTAGSTSETEPEATDVPIAERISVMRELIEDEFFPKILPSLGFNRAPNFSIHMDTVLGLLANLVRNQWYSDAIEVLAYDLDLDADDLPRRQSITHQIRKLDIEPPSIASTDDRVRVDDRALDPDTICGQFKCARNRWFELADDRDLLGTSDIAIDTVNWRFYGEEAPWNVKVEPKDNSNLAWQFISLALVGDSLDRQFVLSTLPVKSKANVTALPKRMIRGIHDHADPRRIYFDREFAAGETIRLCRDLGVDWVIQAKDSGDPGRVMRYMQQQDRDRAIKRDTDFADVSPSPNIIGVRRHPSATGSGSDSVTAYLTDIDPGFEGLQSARHLHSKFNDRWAIESAFNDIQNKFVPLSQSPSAEVRVYYFRTGVLFYNLYQLTKSIIETEVADMTADSVTALEFLTAFAEAGLKPESRG